LVAEEDHQRGVQRMLCLGSYHPPKATIGASNSAVANTDK